VSKRFTETGKWEDPWYRKLSPQGKLLFDYICDKCNLAGFWEIDTEVAAFFVGYPKESLDEALKEICRCYETDGTYLWIVRFIQFQGNFPFKENKTAKKIIELLQKKQASFKNVAMYLSGDGFSGTGVGLEWDSSGTRVPPGIGIGQGIGNSNLKSKVDEKNYSPEFEEFWKIFKGMDRAEAKPLTYGNWNATLKGRDGGTGHPPVAAETIIQAAKNYRDYCLAEGTTRNYIMQSASFIGPKKRGWEGYLKPKKVSKKGKNEIGLVIPVENGVYSHLGRQK